MFFFSVIVVGTVSILNLPIELTPNFEYPQLTITISWPNVSPEAVESFLTSPVEAELSTLQGLKKISSISSEGLSQISLEFHPVVDIDFTRVEINEKLLSLKSSLPAGISIPQISSFIPEDFRKLQGFLTYSISSNHSSNYVRKYLKDNLLMSLKNIDGVSNVQIVGGSDRLIEIIVDYDKTKLLDVSEKDIETAIDKIEKYLSVGKIERKGNQIFINIKNKISTPKEIENHVVKILQNNQAIRFKDIATVIDDYEEQKFFYRINGKETISLIIDKEPNSNTLKVAKEVDSKLKKIATSFPLDFILKKEIDRSEDINKDLFELYRDGAFSILIILIVISFLFRSLRYSIIIISSILFSLFSAFTLFYLFNISLNVITFASLIIGFGFIVDNSIVVLDFIEQYNYKESKPRLTVLLKDIFSPLLVSTLTIIIAFIPLIFQNSELKFYFQQFTYGIIFTLLSSLVVSFSIIPQLYLKFVKHKKRIKTIFEKENIFTRILDITINFIITWKKFSIAFLILCIGIPTWLIPDRIEDETFGNLYNSIFNSDLYQELKPKLNYIFGGALNLYFNHISRGEFWNFGEETYLLIRMEMPNGNRVEPINELCKKLENEILAYRKNIKNVITNVNDATSAIIKVEFTREQAYSVFPLMLKNYINSYVSNLGGVNTYLTGFGPGFSTGGGNLISNFITIIKGYNYEKVKAIAESFSKVLMKNPRVENVDINKSKYYWENDTYEIVGTINREKLSEYGISVSELFSLLSKTTQGNITYSHFNISNEFVNYQIKFSNYDKVQLEDLKKLILVSNGREKLKVEDLINFKEQKVLSSIVREDQQYIRLISFDFKGPYKFGKRFLQSSIENLKLPEGYSIMPHEFKMDFGEEDEKEIWLFLLISLALIYMSLVAYFESFKIPLLIITSSPFAIVGAIFLFWVTDSVIERGAFAGMLLLLGLSISNSIVLVKSLTQNQNRSELISSVKKRLRALTATTITTFVALLPFIISSNSTFWKSVGISVTGGIISSFLYIIFFLPMFYEIFFSRHKTSNKNISSN